MRVVVDTRTGEIVTGYPTNIASEEPMSEAEGSYYEVLQGRLRAVLGLVADQLPRITVALVTEFLIP